MADLKPAYLIHGDDEVNLDAWRKRLRDRAQREDASLELMHAERDSGEAVAMALSSMTLSLGRRYIVVDGIERWKDKDVTALADALAAPPPDTVILFVGTARKESGRRPWSVPAKLVKAVEKAGGEVNELAAPRANRLPSWIAEQASGLGLTIDRDGAQALVERVGADQRRLLRELEKMATYAPEGDRVDRDVVEALTVSDVEARAYELADAVVAGDQALAMRLAEDLRDRGADIMHILYALLGRVHEMRLAWAVIDSGGSSKDVEGVVSGPPWKAKKLASQARTVDGERLERIAGGLADLDFAIRGGGNVDTETALTLTLAAAA